MKSIALLDTVDFHGDKLQALEQDGKVLVAIRPLCEALGVDYSAQLQKLKRKEWATVAMIATVAEDGKSREMACLDVDSIPMWLAVIEPAKVAPRVRPKLVLFQLEAHRALRDHFLPHRAASNEIPLDIAQGTRLRDEPRLKSEMRALCAMTARASGHSLQFIYGFVRKTYRVGSPFDVATVVWSVVKDTLQAIALGKLFLTRRPRKLLVADTRQVELPFKKSN